MVIILSKKIDTLSTAHWLKHSSMLILLKRNICNIFIVSIQVMKK